MTATASPAPVIVWFRQDLRLADNPALRHAVDGDRPVICLYINDELTPGVRKLGGASKWWLHHSLTALAEDIAQFGGRLILRSGAAADIVTKVAEESGADAIVWNRRYGAAEQDCDAGVKSGFDGEAHSFDGLLMHEPTEVRTGAGNPYKVYTPFWKSFDASDAPREPLPKVTKINGFDGTLESEDLSDWHLLPTKPDWSGGIADHWEVGERAAHVQMREFLKTSVEDYDKQRDFPAIDGTSSLSPHLRFGEISPHTLWQAAMEADAGKGGLTWRKELVWREFAYHLLHHFPDIPEENFQKKYDAFPWRQDGEALARWQKGETGYPIVDAGMRQLWQTGWMHNRVRMIVGSFLVKHLLIHWRDGEDWFWDTLVDADPASNAAQWQWVAGTGADAAPYFRIFNPITQAEKFDPDGNYIRQWVPELADLPTKYLGAPWEAPKDILAKANVVLGETYPKPIVDHKEARQRALDALSEVKG